LEFEFEKFIFEIEFELNIQKVKRKNFKIILKGKKLTSKV